MSTKLGHCACCGVTREVVVSGLVRNCGSVCAIGAAIGLRKPEIALLAIVMLLFGDAIEEWIKSRCPECGAALQILGAVARL